MIRKIAIVGAGFSGAITAINLLRATKTPIKVMLIDAVRADAKGLAYSTFDDNFVLNVPAQNMSAFPDSLDDFAEYCNAEDSALVSASFVSRRIYGEYLKHHLVSATQAYPDDLILLKERVVALSKAGYGYQLHCASGRLLDAHTIVLAFGHFAPKPLDELFPSKIDPNALIVNNPWHIHAIDNVSRDKDVLIVGTGHTAIDTLFRLETAVADRRVLMFSRHGLYPHGHRPIGEFHKDLALQTMVQDKVLNALARTHSVHKVMQAVRHLISDLDVNWRDVINALRPITPQIWQNLPPTERARFLRHIVPYWDVARHRLSPLAIKRLTSSVVEGRTRIGAYSIQKIEAQKDGVISVSARCRYTNNLESFKVGAVINCSGPTYDITKTGNELVSFLFNNGILCQDDMKLGFRVGADYSTSPKYPHLYYVGPMLKATYWEAIAVPELRVHSARLAQTILGDSQ
jgi:uncharacterized NAD(P)/FAD-binding protein YdhS